MEEIIKKARADVKWFIHNEDAYLDLKEMGGKEGTPFMVVF